MSFLTTRVTSPDVDDYKKMKRLLKYIEGTMDLPLKISIDSMNVTKWYVDSSHAVHNDMRGQTGACMTMGKGMTCSSSTKQKLNTRSSTESELVGLHDVLPQVIWTKRFIEVQGY